MSTDATKEHDRERRRGRNAMTLAVHYSSATDEWPTPQKIFDGLNAEFGFTLDPCCTAESAKCSKFYTKAEDGLQQDWSTERVFMNPPYGRDISQWMKKAYGESLRGALVVCLVPARTDTEWWHTYAMRGEIRLYKGRIKFVGGKANAPFPSAVVIFRPANFGLKPFTP